MTGTVLKAYINVVYDDNDDDYGNLFGVIDL